MFDDPGKQLHQMEDALLAVEPDEGENLAVDFENNAYEEAFDEDSAVLVPEKSGRAGGATLALLLAIIAALAAARWCFGWI